MAPHKAPNKGEKLSDKEKFNNKVWRFLGDFYCCGFIGNDDRQYLYYHKAGKHIQVADTEMVMAYALLRDRHFEEASLPFTVATFEDWLKEQGVPKKPQKRVKRSFPLYD